MNATGQILLEDRRKSLIRQVQLAVRDSDVLAAFASYILSSSGSITIDLDAIFSKALSVKGAARTFRETSVLGYAIVLGRASAEIESAFIGGIQQLSGRDFRVGGTNAPVCDDSISLLGLALGCQKLPDGRIKAWLAEACRIGGTRHNAAVCDQSITRLAASIVSDGAIAPPAHPSLHLAARARGLVKADDAIEDMSLAFFTSLHSNQTIADDEAILSLASIEWLFRSAPVIDINAPSVSAIRDILKNTNASLHRWVFENEPRTKGATARQWHIDNEYHVQSLLWAILAPVFPELKEEEWLSSIGQKKPRADLCLPALRLIIEVKFLRMGTKVQDVIEQVAADTGLYLNEMSPYSSIVVFIWDDTASSDQHHVLLQGLKSLNGVVDVFIQSRPSRFGLGVSNKKRALKK